MDHVYHGDLPFLLKSDGDAEHGAANSDKAREDAAKKADAEANSP